MLMVGPAGWIAVVHPVDAPTSAELRFFSSVHDILAVQPELRTIAIDIPIGLPENADRSAAAAPTAKHAPVLGQRPIGGVRLSRSRAAVMCSDYRTACAAALETSDPHARCPSKPSICFQKIREVDSVDDTGTAEPHL